MTKVCEKQFPKGSFPGQKSPGYFINETLKENLDIFAKAIARDNTFIILISGKGMVRTGKSVLLQQIGTYLTSKINELHSTNNIFSIENISFDVDGLIKNSLKLPKFSILGLDEGDDITLHPMSERAQRYKKFFRKCGQLNHIYIIILPDFFELPRHYAVVRSNILLNVKFLGEFERGFFEFYSFKKKKKLYLLGKKYSDYDCVKPDFEGRFLNFFTIDKKAYLGKKRRDLQQQDQYDSKTKVEKERDYRVKLFKQIIANTDIPARLLAKGFGVSERTAMRYLHETPENSEDVEDV